MPGVFNEDFNTSGEIFVAPRTSTVQTLYPSATISHLALRLSDTISAKSGGRAGLRDGVHWDSKQKVAG
ncbi:hypothetical protein ACJJJB_07245 [Microbulbifer sp. ANSA001]|uniref:hypothetical protein n=1 Tax=Microbulbifer sp. ANSA001 TaxID=3243358 RepID=UPI004042C4AC